MSEAAAPAVLGDSAAAHGAASIAAGSKSFAAASKLLPPGVREDAQMLYAWCRHCDDVVDGQEMGHGAPALGPAEAGRRLEILRRETEAALEGRPADHPVWKGIADVVERRGIPGDCLRRHLDGFQMDADERHYTEMADTLDYCDGVAGVVGVMMARVMGVTDAPTLERARDLGLAFQLTNIARDLAEDARGGRVYVPEALLRRHDAPAGPAALARPESWPAAHAAVLQMLEEAERRYASAREGVRALPFRCRWAIATALLVYRRIGLEVARRGPDAWASRVSTGGASKAWLATRGLGMALS